MRRYSLVWVVVWMVMVVSVDGQSVSQVVEGMTVEASTTYAYWKRVGLDAVLADAGKSFTVFVPSETAWQAAGPGGIQYFENNAAELERIMRYHITEGSSLNSIQASSASPITTLQTSTLSVTPDGTGFKVNSVASITTADIAASNGMVHIVNRLLIYPGSPTPTRTVQEIVSQEPDLTELDAKLQTISLRNVLSSPLATYTFIAPTNAAWAKLTPFQTAGLSDTNTVLRVLNHHTSPTYLPIQNPLPVLLPTLDTPNNLLYTRTPYAFNASVILREIPAVNGVVYTIEDIIFPAGILVPFDIMQVINANPNLKNTSEKLTRTGLDATLRSTGPYTVFAPTDAAWAALESGVIGFLERDTSGLQGIMSYHLINSASYTEAVLRMLSTVTSAQGGVLTVTLMGVSLVINSASTVVLADQVASNGMVHIVDQVLIAPNIIPTLNIVSVVGGQPLILSRTYSAILQSISATLSQAGPMTFLAPSDAAFNTLTQSQLNSLLSDTVLLSRVMSYHTLPLYVSVNDMLQNPSSTYSTLDGSNTLAKTVSGPVITFSDGTRSVQLNRTFSDNPATNGIVHIVDGFLLPPGVPLPGDTVVDVISGRLETSQFSSLLTIAGINTDLQQTGPFTVFPPADSAFASLPSGAVPYLTHRPGVLQQVLLYHVFLGNVKAASLQGSSPFKTVQGDLLSITRSGARLLLDGVSQITIPDLQASNGVVHVVDTLVLPFSVKLPSMNLLEVVVSEGGTLSTFRTMVSVGTMEGVLQGAGALTLFAPSNTAMTNLDSTTRTLLLADPTMLAKVIRYTLVQGYYDVSDLTSTAPSSLITLDAPNTLSYATATSQRILVDGNSEIVRSIPANNGVLHVMTQLLIPPNTIPMTPPSTAFSLWEVVNNRTDTSSFAYLVSLAGQQTLLQSSSQQTLFVPSNTALLNLPTGITELLQRQPSLLANIIKYHLLTAGAYSAGTLASVSPAMTAQGQTLKITHVTTNIMIDDKALVTVPDVPASNGVIHVINELVVPSGAGLPTMDLLQTIQSQQQLTTFYSSAVAAHISTELQVSGPLTVFAPTDAAFAVYPQLAAVTSDPSVLRLLLEHHIHPQYKDSVDLVKSAPSSLNTLAVSQQASSLISYTLGAGNVILLNNVVRVTISDIRATNGVLHMIDAVLPVTLPPSLSSTLQEVLEKRADTTDFASTTRSVGLYNELSSGPGTGSAGPYTVFAPSNQAWAALPAGVREMLSRRLDILTNVMRYHVVAGFGLTAVAAPQASPATTMQGQVVTISNSQYGLQIQQAIATVRDLRASNGVAHVIDQVLDYPGSPLPKQNLVQVISTTPSLTQFSALLRSSATLTTLLSTGLYTVIAPTDLAFSRLPTAEYNALLNDPESALRDHIIQEYLAASDFLSTSPGVKQVLNPSQTITYRAGTGSTSGSSLVTFNYETSRPSTLQQADIPATNGVVHIVDMIITPGTGVPPPPGTTVAPVSSVSSVLVWGDANGGGDASTVAALLGTMERIYSNDAAFVAVPSSGVGLIAWGNTNSGGLGPSVSGFSAVTDVKNTRTAFAALRADGSVIAWGDAAAGGNAQGVQLSCCITSVTGSSRAFAAVKTDGSVVSWGDSAYGGNAPVLQQISDITANDGAFAARSFAGGVATWGIGNQGGDSTTVVSLLTNVVGISSTYSSFAAIRSDGSVVAWGAANTGGNSATVQSLLTGVQSVAATANAFAALKNDGTVVAWGTAAGGGDASAVAQQLRNVKTLFTTEGAFAALTFDNRVVTWGGPGGDSAQVQPLTNVNAIYSTDSAFAAVRNDGTVSAWGSPGYGGSIPASTAPLLVGVTSIVGTSRAFAASRSDGVVVTWGDVLAGGDPGIINTQLLTPIGSARSVASTNTAFAAFSSVLPSNGCNILTCNGNHISYSQTGSVCTCVCKPNYSGAFCDSCAPGYLNYPICAGNVITPTPWFSPSYSPLPQTPLPSQLPLPTPPPTSCLIWTDCNGHASSVTDNPLGPGCICQCYNNYGGAKCNTCATGYVDYPACAQGIWVLVSETRACYMNSEDSQPVYGSTTDLLPSLLACQQSCSERNWCAAVDWYRTTQVCRMYSDSCADPKDPFDGASHWRLVSPSAVTTPVPTDIQTPSPAGCPWVSPTGRHDEYDCSDGTTCNLVIEGTNCCSNRRGRLRCPDNLPVMCSAVDADCDNDYCCVTTAPECASNGGPRPCTNMDVTPCGLSREGGDGKVWTGSSSVDAPPLTGISGVYANSAAYAAVTTSGSVITWGADYAGGDSGLVANDLRSGVVKVFSTDRAFAALTDIGRVITWGDNGLGQNSDPVMSLLQRDVKTIYSTDNAFAALKLNGGVVTWGHKYYGADSSTVASLLASGVERIFSTNEAFAALKLDGSVVTWGAPHQGGGNSNNVGPLLGTSPGVRAVYAADSAFAALRKDGSVVTWGYNTRGGDSSTVAAYLLRDVVSIFSTGMAFAAIKSNRSVVVWGEAAAGGDSSTVSASISNSVEKIFSTTSSFAAVLSNGRVVTWGDDQTGGRPGVQQASLLTNVQTIASTDRAFAALRADGTVVPWGDAGFGGDGTGVDLTNIKVVYSNQKEFAAVRTNGKVVVWSSTQGSGTTDYVDCQAAMKDVTAYNYGLGVRSVVSTANSFAFLTESPATPAPTKTPEPAATPTPAVSVYQPVAIWGDPLAGGLYDKASELTCGTIYSTLRAFAAIKADGSVVTWGDPGYGGDSTTVTLRLQGGIDALFSTDRAFAAVSENGSVVVWGDQGYGGLTEPLVTVKLISGVKTIYSTQLSFAAVKDDGSVVTWGDPYYGGTSTAVAPFLASGVVGIYNTDQAFAALKQDGSVVTWGAGFSGADSQLVRQDLQSGVQSIYKTYSAFAALKTGGSVVTWGYPGRGGDSTTVASQLLASVQAIASTEMAFAALKKQQGSQTAGTVVVWGDAGYGGDASTVAGLLSSGVRAVYSTERAFAAVKTDGSVVAWGNTSYGGSHAQVSSQLKGIVEIYSTERAFAALLDTGRVVTWGDSGYGGTWSASAAGLNDVRVLYSTNRAFAALKGDGSVSSWGNTEFGGDVGATQSLLLQGQKAVYSTEAAFAALVPCELGSKLRPVGQGACLDSMGRRYGELKSDVDNRAGCLQILLQFSPPARGATWWPPQNGLGGCYVAVDNGTTIVGGQWNDRFSFDTTPSNSQSDPRDARGQVASSDGQPAMECIAADDVAFVPTPPPGTAAPPAPPTASPPVQIQSWVLVKDGAACERNNEGIQPSQHNFPLASLDSCRKSCEITPGCVAVDFYETGWCNLYDRACSDPQDFKEGSESWKRVTGTGPGMAVVTWGDSSTGGNSATVASLLQSGVTAAYGNDMAFAALKSDGTVVTWGGVAAGGDSTTVESVLRLDSTDSIVSIEKSDTAFAVLSKSGKVTAWGSSSTGGSTSTVSSLIMSNVAGLYSSNRAFATVTPTGIVAWGDAQAGGDATTVASLVTGVDTVQSTSAAFAALTPDDRVVTWGAANSGGDSSSVAVQLSITTRKVRTLYSNDGAFAALRDDGSVVTWGDAGSGGDMSTVASLLSSGVLNIYNTDTAFTALKADGSVVSWGNVNGGGAAPVTATNVRFISNTKSAFAALQTNGNIVTWGEIATGGNRTSTTGGVQHIVGAKRTFAAILSDGRVEVWGDPQTGGVLPVQLTTVPVGLVAATSAAFVALKSGGGAVAWGDQLAGGNVNPVASQLLNVASVSSTTRSFAALVPTLEVLPPIPPSTGLDTCDETQWIVSPTKRCISGQDAVGFNCDQVESGSVVDRFYCAYRPSGSGFVCARCPVVIQTPTPATTAAPGVDTSTNGASHKVIVCGDLTINVEKKGTSDFTQTITCPSGGQIEIEAAVWGRQTCEGSFCMGNIGVCPTAVPCTMDALQIFKNLCDGRSACNLDTTAPGLIDPCGPGVPKFLDIRYTCNAFICEKESTVEWGRSTGQVADVIHELNCGADSQIVIDAAVFGRTTCFAHVCYASPGSNCATTSCSANATSIARNTCDGKSTCTLQASSQVYGDPCPGENKYLDVKYTCQGTASTDPAPAHAACKNINGDYYKAFKKGGVTRAECVSMLRVLRPPARSAMFGNTACYIMVDSNVVSLPEVVWDAAGSMDQLSDKECIRIQQGSAMTPAPPTTPGTGAPSSNGTGLCGQLAKPLRVCVDTTNGYWCDGKCCCEEQREWRCNPATGQCVYQFQGSPDTPLPGAGPGTVTVSPLPGVTPGGQSPPAGGSTFPPDPTTAGDKGTSSDDSGMPTWVIILIVVLVVLCLCCAIIAYACGRRNSKRHASSDVKEPLVLDYANTNKRRQPQHQYEEDTGHEMYEAPPRGYGDLDPFERERENGGGFFFDDDEQSPDAGAGRGNGGAGRNFRQGRVQHPQTPDIDPFDGLPPPPEHRASPGIDSPGPPVGNQPGASESPKSFRGLERNYPSSAPRSRYDW